MPIKKSDSQKWEVWCEVCGFKGKYLYHKAMEIAMAHKKGYHHRH